MKNQTSLRVWAFAAALIAGAACGSVSNSKPDAGGTADATPAGEFTLSVNPGTVSVGITGKATIVVDLSRGDGFTDAVALSATDLPTGVTAEFDAASLPDGTNATNLVLTVDDTADAGVSTVTVTGTAGELTRSTTLELTLTTATVSGSLRIKGTGVVVRIVGKPATTTDADGNFTFTDVKVPYDIYVLGQGGPSNAPIPSVSYYKGLTSTAPVLTRTSTFCVGVCTVLLPYRYASVSGVRLGSGTNAGPTYLSFTNASGSQINTDGSWGPDDLSAGWITASPIGVATREVRLNGLQAIRGTLNSPTGWYHAQSGAVTVSTASNTTINLSLGALATTANLTGTITPPATYSTPKITLSQTLAGTVFEVWTATSGVATSTIPVLADQKASFYVESTSGSAKTEGVFPGLTAATDVSMTLPAAAVLTSPVNSASNINTTTPFEFTTTSNQVYEVYMESDSAIFVIYTAEGSVTIPEVPEMPLPSDAAFSWLVRGYAPHGTIDDAVNMVGLRNVNRYEAEGTMHMMSTSVTRNFTSQ